jgi:hypothetical protein
MRHNVFLAAVVLALTVAAARADHARPGLFTDVGVPPAEEDASHSNVSAELMVDRCSNFLANARFDVDGHVADYQHNYQAGFCLGWVNASMVFLNVRDSAGAPALGVCLPEGIHTFEVIRNFLDFVKANPKDLKYNPSFLIYWAMLDKYPCKH